MDAKLFSNAVESWKDCLEESMEQAEYQVDLAMCGSNFTGDVERVAEYLTQHGYPAVAITDSYNGAESRVEDGIQIEPPESLWLAALEYAEAAA